MESHQISSRLCQEYHRVRCWDLLFLIYINDIDLHQNEGSLLLYADDLLLYHPIQSPEDYLKLQGDIDQLQAWSEQMYSCLTKASVNT